MKTYTDKKPPFLWKRQPPGEAYIVLGPDDGVSSIHGRLSFKAEAGHHLAPKALSAGRNVFEDLSDGFTLLAFDADDAAVRALQDGARRCLCT